MRLMGTDSVGYHERTVLERGDDPVGNALDYYASRGETPMVWGGAGAATLGVEGEVALDEWRAVFGAGGACHPESGERLVHCMRPGMELVVSPHKSVAELGVIGRAEDMHALLDVETQATLAYLDQVVQEQGGRRGRTQVRSPTDGLTWAVSRHATTRAGDPQVHDHVLLANLLRMRDERGGWKALDTGLVRDHLHAATAVGRMAAAAKAVALGYGIEPDPGPSGRLGAWAISGIPKDAWQVHATRSAQIDAAVGPEATYRARAIAARATRDRKAHEHVEDLVARWRDELARAGYPPPELATAVERAGLEYKRPELSHALFSDVADELLSPGGRLASEKTFSRLDAVVAVAPYLHGLPVSVLDEAVEQVLCHEKAIALPLVRGAREPVFAATCVLEDERRIASLADVLAEREGPSISHEDAAAAVRQTELSGGLRLSERQTEVATALLTSGHAMDLVLGVAGSGKTSTLSAVRAGFEAAGYTVLGAATSGQAAKALGEGAGVSSSTVASLTWRLEHQRLALGPRHILVLDEGAMTADADVGRLFAAVEASGSKLVAVGDFRQLGAVGPGGALEALAARHPGHVWTLTDNLRQRDPAERLTLDHLRAGNLPAAVNWYVAQGRVHPARNSAHAMLEMIRAGAHDAAAGRDGLLVAYHRDAVEILNRTARQVWEKLGQLSGPELEAPGGRRYRAGDRVITLSPGPRGAWVNSQRAVVRSVDPHQCSLVAVTPEGTELHMGPKDIGVDQLGYSFALTAHRAQGATVDATYALADGGGRELAYVAMSTSSK
jgi:conjugative relaxase-like TrwC/TraI family protein